METIEMREIIERIEDIKGWKFSEEELVRVGSYIGRGYYGGYDRPKFKSGEYVEVDLGKVYEGGSIESGRILGVHVSGERGWRGEGANRCKKEVGVGEKLWVIEFEHDFGLRRYDYKVVVIEQGVIIKYEYPEEIIRLDDGEIFVKSEENLYEVKMGGGGNNKKEGIYRKGYSIHTLMVVQRGRFMDRVIYDKMRENRKEEMKWLIGKGGGEWEIEDELFRSGSIYGR